MINNEYILSEAEALVGGILDWALLKLKGDKI